MDSITFSYNKWYKAGNLLILTIPLFVCVHNAYKGFKDTGTFAWPWVVAICLTYLAFIIFLLFKFVIPGLSGKPALVLNSEEVRDCTSNKTIYWDNVADITLSEIFSLVTFKMKDGKKVRIDVGRFKGGNSEIFSKILAYYKNYDQSIAPNIN
jgi:hypothetical protein